MPVPQWKNVYGADRAEIKILSAVIKMEKNVNDKGV